jgi:hypothetical protein
MPEQTKKRIVQTFSSWLTQWRAIITKFFNSLSSWRRSSPAPHSPTSASSSLPEPKTLLTGSSSPSISETESDSYLTWLQHLRNNSRAEDSLEPELALHREYLRLRDLFQTTTYQDYQNALLRSAAEIHRRMETVLGRDDLLRLQGEMYMVKRMIKLPLEISVILKEYEDRDSRKEKDSVDKN